jgi:hypothetical protein
VLRNATERYRTQGPAIWTNETPRFINLGDPLYQPYLGPGWGPCADGFRNLRGSATLRIGVTHVARQRLVLTIFYSRDPALSVRVDGEDSPAQPAARSAGTWELTVNLSEAKTTKPEIEINLTNTGREPLRFGFAQIIPDFSTQSVTGVTSRRASAQ